MSWNKHKKNQKQRRKSEVQVVPITNRQGKEMKMLTSEETK